MSCKRVFVLAASLLVTLLGTTAVAGQRTDRVVPCITPTPTPTRVFAATMSVLPSSDQVAVGDMLTVTVAISVSEGCQYPIFELVLTQEGEQGAPFDYASPPTDLVEPPVSNPFTYTLTAVGAGTVVFRGQAYGERYCGDYWNWTYVRGRSEPVYVGAAPPYGLVHLPLVVR